MDFTTVIGQARNAVFQARNDVFEASGAAHRASVRLTLAEQHLSNVLALRDRLEEQGVNA